MSRKRTGEALQSLRQVRNLFLIRNNVPDLNTTTK